MNYAEPCLDQFVRKEFIPVFERWLYFGALRILNRVSSDKPLRQGSVALRRSLAVSPHNTWYTAAACAPRPPKTFALDAVCQIGSVAHIEGLFH